MKPYMLFLFTFPIILAQNASCLSQNNTDLSLATTQFSAKVIGVSDGDTITVLRDRTSFKIRLYGVDCPENGQAYSQKSKKFTSDLCYRRIVTVMPKTKDRFGRIVAKIFLENGRDLSHEIILQTFFLWNN